MMISFHLPPKAAEAAVSGQLLIGFRLGAMVDGYLKVPSGGVTKSGIGYGEQPLQDQRMIVEIRTYTTKPGLRRHFLDLFKQEAVPLQRSLGIQIVGPFVDMANPDVFVWIRAFPSSEERDRMKESLYQGDKWKGDLEAVIMPLLDRYHITVADIPDWFVNDIPLSLDQVG